MHAKLRMRYINACACKCGAGLRRSSGGTPAGRVPSLARPPSEEFVLAMGTNHARIVFDVLVLPPFHSTPLERHHLGLGLRLRLG